MNICWIVSGGHFNQNPRGHSFTKLRKEDYLVIDINRSSLFHVSSMSPDFWSSRSALQRSSSSSSVCELVPGRAKITLSDWDVGGWWFMILKENGQKAWVTGTRKVFFFDELLRSRNEESGAKPWWFHLESPWYSFGIAGCLFMKIHVWKTTVKAVDVLLEDFKQ